MSVRFVNKVSKELFIIVSVLFVLYLTAINISSIFKPKTKVLGAETETGDRDRETLFWNEFLKTHPNYIPGWIEIGKMDKVREIDPNFKLEIRN